MVNAGLYWLFRECKNATSNQSEKEDFGNQAITCRDNLETVLANLPFHQPSTPEATTAMMIAVCQSEPFFDSLLILIGYILPRNMQAICRVELHRDCVPHESDIRHTQHSVNVPNQPRN